MNSRRLRRRIYNEPNRRLLPFTHNNKSSQFSESNFETNTTEHSEIISVNRQSFLNRLTPVDKIAFWSMAFNGLMALATLATLWVTYDTLATTKDEIESSDLQFKETIAEIKRSAIATEKSAAALEGSNKISQDTYLLSDSALRTQISSIRAAKQEFEISNEAYLETYDFANLDFEGKNPSITFKIKNIGNQPVRVVYNYSSFFLGSPNLIKPFDAVADDDKENRRRTPFAVRYLTKDIPLQWNCIKNGSTPPELLKEIQEKTLSIYPHGEIYYQNLITRKLRVYKYIIEIQGYFHGWRVVYSDNYEIKKFPKFK
jgi:hypothetical protein